MYKLNYIFISFMFFLISCKENITQNLINNSKTQNRYKFDQNTDVVSTDSIQNANILDLVLGQLNLDKSKIKQEFVVSKAIPNKSNETILVIPEIDMEQEDYFELNSYIVIVNNKTGKITNKYFENNAWTSDAIMLTEIIIDTNPYQISEHDRAFGIRISYTGSSQPNPYENETITLFVKTGNSLKRILNNYEIMYFGGEWDTNCIGEFVAHKKTINVSKNKTNTYYDLIINNNIVVTKNYLDSDDECKAIKTTSKDKTVLKFNGLEYK